MGVQTPPFLHFKTFSHRFAEQVLNSRLAIKEEILSVITDPAIDVAILSRPYFIKVLRDSFTQKGWQDQPSVFDEEGDPAAKMDFLKERVGIEIGFGHASFIGIDLLKFQVSIILCAGSNRCRHIRRDNPPVPKALSDPQPELGRQPYI